MAKLYSVRIKYKDDGSEFDTLICDSDSILEERDEEIFFYGFSKETIEHVIENCELCEGEWYILELYGEKFTEASTQNNRMTLRKLFEKQIERQKIILKRDSPVDDPVLSHLFMTSGMIEFAEATQEDKRWRKLLGSTTGYCDVDKKVSELADVLICITGAVIFSGYDYNRFMEVLDAKFNENTDKILKNLIKEEE